MTTIDKAAEVLAALAGLSPRAQLATLVEETGIPKPTLYRILRVLQERGLVQQDEAGMYRIGHRVFSLAAQAFHRFKVDDEIRRVMVDLGRRVHLTVHVSGFRADQLIYLDKLEADTPFSMRSEIGRLQAIHSSAIGKSVLAELAPAHARRVLEAHTRQQFTPYTVVDIETILRGLPTIKERGFAVDDEEDELSTRAIGAAFRDAAGNPIGGISIVAPTFATSMAELEAFAPLVMEAAASIQALIPQPEAVSV
ncbi:IclR family transcriptional regulator [Streptomyces shenzhenensis]|uniref:IclR family transcriptional regulator n=1 Tax=Streptomyces shenzhenensis TaxID=943815 RepID=UPI003815643C